MVKPFVLEQYGYPIDQAKNYACTYTTYNDRSCNCEHLGSGDEDYALCLCQLGTHYLMKNIYIKQAM